MNLPKWGLLAAMIILALEACTSTRTQLDIKPVQSFNQYEGIVVLADTNKKMEFSDHEAEDCLSDGMREANPRLRIVPAQKFRDDLFPYFSTNTTPHTTEEYRVLFNKPSIRRRINELGIRYLVLQSKVNNYGHSHGRIICEGGEGGGGCFGLVWFDRTTILTAQIWDLKRASLEGNVQSGSTGTGVIVAPILPIPVYVPFTESASCQEAGARLAKALAGTP